MGNKKEFDYSISLIRIIGCLLIFICHWMMVMGNPAVARLSQIFNVGVFVFFIISGYLYGTKYIDKRYLSKWYFQRIIKLFVPLYLVMTVVFIGMRMQGLYVSSEQYIVFGLNLQGFFGKVQGGAQLWFLTVIMICYIVTPLYQKMKELDKKIIIFIGSVYFIIQIVTSIAGLGNVPNYLMYIGVYGMAYFVLPKIYNRITKKELIIYTIIMLIAMGIRLGTRSCLDGTNIYDYIVALYTHLILGIWIVVAIKYFYEEVKEKLNHDLIKKIDGYTMEIYMVHVMFMYPPFQMMGRYGTAVDTVMVIICTVISAFLLKAVETFVVNKISKHIKL